MRRITLLAIAVLCGAGLTAGTVTLASSGEGDRAAERRQGTAPKRGAHRPGHGRGLHRAIKRMVLKSLAGRLDVEPRALRLALRKVARERWAARLEQAGLSTSEIAALKACHRHAHRRAHRRAGAPARSRATRSACDRAAARSARRKLQAAPDPDLAAIKNDAAAALAAELSVPEDKLLEAVRAELVQRLDQGVGIGLLTSEVRDQALACFDTPATCDLRALHRSARMHGRQHRG